MPNDDRIRTVLFGEPLTQLKLLALLARLNKRLPAPVSFHFSTSQKEFTWVEILVPKRVSFKVLRTAGKKLKFTL